MHPQDSYAKAAILEHTCAIMVDVLVAEADAALFFMRLQSLRLFLAGVL